ncbi:ABC transporter permease [Microbacterium sp. MPKO10]|uniref:ABC transporter permease n=1 Tax=Microbacterium sp. MPKO10 TaxID=2989818 RepID=UPI00223664E8|nr:ABC transporter permease [Microbacterium sp. MPKO10]MCW4458813.1 ABC transporter permease [Microbacterium sp. MPKO10]
MNAIDRLLGRQRRLLSTRGQFYEVSAASAKELLRSSRSVFTMIVMFAVILVITLSLTGLVSSTSSGPGPALNGGLSLSLTMGFMAIAFVGTTVPLVSYRGRGTLRLLGTTPLRRLLFVLAQAPVRFGIAAGEFFIVAACAVAFGHVGAPAFARLAVTATIGFAMLMSFAFLLASRMSDSDFVSIVSSLLPLIAILSSGSFIHDIVPRAVQILVNYVPTTWFIRALDADLNGTHSPLSVPVLWSLMAGTAALTIVLTSVIFNWDQGDRD